MASPETLLITIEGNDAVGAIHGAIDDMVSRVMATGIDPDVGAWVRLDVESAVGCAPDDMLECEVVAKSDPPTCTVNVSVSAAFRARTVAAVSRIYRRPAVV